MNQTEKSITEEIEKITTYITTYKEIELKKTQEQKKETESKEEYIEFECMEIGEDQYIEYEALEKHAREMTKKYEIEKIIGILKSIIQTKGIWVDSYIKRNIKNKAAPTKYKEKIEIPGEAIRYITLIIIEEIKEQNREKRNKKAKQIIKILEICIITYITISLLIKLISSII